MGARLLFIKGKKSYYAHWGADRLVDALKEGRPIEEAIKSMELEEEGGWDGKVPFDIEAVISQPNPETYVVRFFFLLKHNRIVLSAVLNTNEDPTRLRNLYKLQEKLSFLSLLINHSNLTEPEIRKLLDAFWDIYKTQLYKLKGDVRLEKDPQLIAL